jgi:hypothetical protein
MDAEKKLRCALNKNFKVNVVVDQQNEKYGYSYLFFEAAESSYIVEGKNPDGSNRVSLTPDPNWVPPQKDVTFSLDNFVPSNNWIDLVEEEEADKAANTCPMIETPLEPLVTIPLIPFHNDEQKKEMFVVMVKEWKYLSKQGQVYPQPTYDDVPPGIKVTFTRACPKDPAQEYLPHVLCGLTAESWMDEKIFFNLFRPFVTDKTVVANRKVNGEFKDIQYPFVEFDRYKGLVFVGFDHRSRDALSALLMMRKTEIYHEGKKYELSFYHCLRTRRDLFTYEGKPYKKDYKGTYQPRVATGQEGVKNESGIPKFHKPVDRPRMDNRENGKKPNENGKKPNENGKKPNEGGKFRRNETTKPRNEPKPKPSDNSEGDGFQPIRKGKKRY